MHSAARAGTDSGLIDVFLPPLRELYVLRALVCVALGLTLVACAAVVVAGLPVPGAPGSYYIMGEVLLLGAGGIEVTA